MKEGTKEALKEHVKIHNNIYHECPNCDFRSQRLRELKKHKCVKKLFL